jgi:hypothetical protein
LIYYPELKFYYGSDLPKPCQRLGALDKPVKKRVKNDSNGELDCMYCGTNTALRSHRKHFFEYLRTRLTGKVPFRCRRCHRRFWAIMTSDY